MAQSILLRSFLLHRRTVLQPSVGRLKCLSAQLHTNKCLLQEAASGKSANVIIISNNIMLFHLGGGGALQESRANSNISTDVRPIGEKIKENTKTASYTAIILAGLGVTGIMFYAIFRELFSKSSSCNIYSKALKRVEQDPRVQDALGAPIKGFGEMSRRGRRQHVAHSQFERNGVPHMRMQFYVQGLRNKATVQLESRRVRSLSDIIIYNMFIWNRIRF